MHWKRKLLAWQGAMVTLAVFNSPKCKYSRGREWLGISSVPQRGRGCYSAAQDNVFHFTHYLYSGCRLPSADTVIFVQMRQNANRCVKSHPQKNCYTLWARSNIGDRAIGWLGDPRHAAETFDAAAVEVFGAPPPTTGDSARISMLIGHSSQVPSWLYHT